MKKLRQILGLSFLDMLGTKRKEKIGSFNNFQKSHENLKRRRKLSLTLGSFILLMSHNL